jgi:predicted transcriptional regulator
MTETLKRRLDALSKRSRRSKSFLAAEAIAAYIEVKERQLEEIRQGIAELESGKQVTHDRVAKWLSTWGRRGETKAPK